MNVNAIPKAFGENNTPKETKKISNDKTMSFNDKIKNILSAVDKKLIAIDKKLPTHTYKTLDFKTGVSMDFSSNGVAIGLIGNVYHNFTPNIASFTGVEYRYNMYQIKNKPSDSIFTPETRTKMDLLFKLGTRFKVKENINVSPYVILGMGYGSVKQEKQYFSGNETTNNITTTRQYTFKGTTNIVKTTNRYDVDGATQATENLDYNAHKSNFNGNYGVNYQIDKTATQKLSVKEITSYNEAQNILNNNIDVYKNTMSYTSPFGTNESYVNFGALPVINVYKNSQEHANASLTILEGQENGVSTQYGYQKNSTEFNANNLSGVYSTIIGNNGRIFAVNTNQDYSEYAKTNTEPCNTSSILNQYVNSALNNFGDLGSAVSISVDTDTLKQQLQSGDLQLSNIAGLTQTQEIVNTDNPLNYNQNIMIVNAKNLKSGEDTYFYYLPNSNGETISFLEAQKQIEEFNEKAVVDKREKLEEDSIKTTTEAKNEITKSVDDVQYSYTDKTEVKKVDTIINQKQKVFFKGGLGLELMFYNRFFVRLEYKYAQLGATNTIAYNINNYKHTDKYVYNTDYTQTNVTINNNVYRNQYTQTYINDNVLTNYNTGAIQGTDGSGNVLGIEITNGGIDSGKSISITQEPTYSYDTEKLASHTNNTEKLGNTTYIENKRTTFHMHEISFGFGFYFL